MFQFFENIIFILLLALNNNSIRFGWGFFWWRHVFSSWFLTGILAMCPPPPSQFYCVSITLQYDACSHSCRPTNKIPRPRERHVQKSKCPRELCSMWWVSLDRRGVWGRKDICICIAESFRPSSEIITTLLTGYTPIQKKKSKCPEEKNELRACVGGQAGA